MAYRICMSCFVWVGIASTLWAQSTVPKEMDGLPLVFQEDFESGAGRWQMTDDKAWEIKEGKVGDKPSKVLGLKVRISDYQPKYRSPHNMALVKDLQLEELIVTFKVRNTEDTGGHRDCCVFFCHQDGEHFYYVHCGAVPDPNSGQIMVVDGAPRTAITQNTNKIPWGDGWHNVKLVRKASTGEIKIYFDDMTKPVMEAKNTRFGKGRIGIGSFDDKNDFDDVAVYGR
ncbi:MAG: hypothetical protein U0930_14960 [Pirellulales bacterium]